MLYREIIAVGSQIHTKHINTLYGQNVELLSVKPGPGGRAVLAMGFRPLAFWDYGFESRRRHPYLLLVSVICCQVEVFATADPSSREVLPSVMCLSATVNPRHWQDANPPQTVAACKKW